MNALPDYAEKLFEPRRYKVLFGGRGSSKSYTIARSLLELGWKQKIRVLCAREFQNSITESVHFLLRQEITEIGLDYFYTVTDSSILGVNGTEFIFKGIRHNINSIKSMAGITHVWLEEAQSVSQLSWDVLIPTIREENSEIWVSFNPENDDDPTYKMFVTKDGVPNNRKDAIVLKVNWTDNPWFPEILKKEKDYLYEVNPDLAEHVWGGACRSHSDAQIFKRKCIVREFEPEECFDGPYLGADFGFSVDPSTLVKIYLDLRPDRMELLIRHAKFGYGVEIDDLPEMYDSVPGSRDAMIYADCARPETISYLARQGFAIEGCEKWKGSVEDGIEWLKMFKKIVIHPECTEMIVESKNYCYKVDRLTQKVLTDIVDAYNHGWDAARYAMQPLIMAGGSSVFDVL